MSLQDYLNLDLTEASKRLYAQVDSEATGSGTRELTDLVGAQPSHLTPRMAQWFAGVIAPIRQPALAEVAQMFRERLPNGTEQGFLLERELAQLDNDFLKSKRECYRDISETHHSEITEIEKLKKSVTARSNEYNSKRAGIGRDAKVLNRPLYSFGLLAILVTESFINFASFSSLSWATPFIATGSTLIVAALVTFAAHQHGSTLKQTEYYFGRGARDAIRRQGRQHILLGVLALIVALGFVYYARSAYLAIYLASLGAFGLSAQGHSPMWIVGGSLLGNVAVYLAGLGWAFLLHDPDPNFPKIKEGLDGDEARLKKLTRLVNGARHRQLDQLSEEWKKNVSEKKLANTDFINRTYFAAPRVAMAALLAKDQGVIEILETYRADLLSKIRGAGTSVKFNARTDDPQAVEEWLEGKYEGQPLKLKFLEE